MRALYLGRFNPPHLGHVKAIEYILAQQDISDIILLIGSGEKAYDPKNLFTGGERLEMLTAIVRKYFDIKRFYIVAIPDSNRNTIWPAHVIDLVPSFDIIFTNNPLVFQLFTNLTNKQVKKIPLVNRKEYSGSEIRKRMQENSNWEGLVPDIIHPLIKQFKGIERIQAISKSDESDVT